MAAIHILIHTHHLDLMNHCHIHIRKLTAKMDVSNESKREDNISRFTDLVAAAYSCQKTNILPTKLVNTQPSQPLAVN